MKTLFLVLGLIFITCISLFSATEQEIIAKLKEIDKAMVQGSISYKNTVLSGKNGKEMSVRNLIYDSKGKSKSTMETIYHDNTKEHIANYIDDRNSFYIHTKDKSVIIANKTDYVFITQFRFQGISANPSLQYGRGITLLENLKIDPINNIATGTNKGFKIIAYLDPKLDYAAYKLERNFGNSGPTEVEINNSKPILIDGKYYIFSKSICIHRSLSQNVFEKDDLEIISATFTTPDEKDYIFDWKNNPFENIIDARGTKKQDMPVEYKKSELPEGITLDELLKITKKRAFKQQFIDTYSKIVPDNASLARIIIVILCLIALFIVIFRKRNKKEPPLPTNTL